ncbi:MAG TPA: hypothetical protein VGF28_10875 [Thermoanaerobaculia bacterium]
MLLIYAPDRVAEVVRRRVSRREHPELQPGDVVRAARQRLRVASVSRRVELLDDGTIENITDVFTTIGRRRAAATANVVQMPTGDDSMVAQFIRYHVLVRVFEGDPDAWVAHLTAGGEAADGGDLRFARWIRSRLRQDPALLGSIRRMVDATPFWRAAEA